MTERLTLVDENDQPIGVGSREDAWTKGHYTRNIRVVIRDEKGRILTQKRSTKKSTYPGMWTVAASGHVDEGEDWDTAARRETQEEIGVTADINFIGSFNFKDDDGEKKIRQIIHVYEATIESKTPLTPQEDEVEEMTWFDMNELQNLVTSSPERFTPSFIQVMERYYL